MADMPVNSVRPLNRSRVLNALIDGAAGRRTELADRLELSAMAVTRIVRELAEAGLVEELDGKVRAEPGRRPVELAIDPAGAYVLGFELHAYQRSVAIMDLARRVIRRRAIELTAPADGAASLAEMAAAARHEIRASGIDPQRLLGAGVAAIGIAGRERGTLVDPSSLGWQPIAAAALLQEQVGVPVVIDRTANAMLAAEASQPGAGLRDALLFNVGFVLSAAFLVDGALARGDKGLAGQIGHLETAGSERLCDCGRRGCLNVIASGWAALADLGELDDPVLSAAALRSQRAPLAELLRRESEGDAAACAALARVGRNLGPAVRALRTTLDPARILISGPVGRAASYVDGVRQGVGDDAVQRCERQVDEAAALMAFDAFIRPPTMDFERLRRAAAPAPA
jgi:predicted NBD/HSP70 family sugar kinase